MKKKKDPGGRPTKYRKDFHPDDFITLSKQGKTLAQIAYIWDVDRDTVQEWRKRHEEFSVAVKKGRQYAEAWYINLGQSAMIGQAKMNGMPIHFNLGTFCWMTKNLFKWSDRVSNEPADTTLHRPLKDMSDEELESYDVRQTNYNDTE